MNAFGEAGKGMDETLGGAATYRGEPRSSQKNQPKDEQMNLLHLLPFAVCALLGACGTALKSDAKVGVDISGVNYSDQPITYIITDPNDRSSVGAEPIDPFGAGGAMCCFRLPPQWQPGIKVRVEILDTNRDPVKNEIVDLPPYVDGKPGRIWAVYYQDGSVDVLSSEYGPPHEKWPGKVRGWPVPTVEYRRKLREQRLDDIKGAVNAAESLIRELNEDPEKSLKSRWEHDRQYAWKRIEPFSGPLDPSYKEFIVKRNEDFLRSAKQRLKDWMERRP